MMEEDQKIVVNEFFFTGISELVSKGFCMEIRTKGKSMMPFILEGDGSVSLKKIEEDSFQLGNLLLARLSEGRYVLHRLIKYEEDQIVLRGDGNLSTVETCTKDDIIAEVGQIKRFGKKIKKGSLLWNMHRKIWLGSTTQRRIMLAIYRRFPFLLNVFFLGFHKYEI